MTGKDSDADFFVIQPVEGCDMSGKEVMTAAFVYPMVAVALSSGEIMTVDIVTKRQRMLLRKTVGNATVMSVAISNDFKYIATAELSDVNNRLVVWSVDDERDIAVLEREENIWHVAFGAVEKEIVCGTLHGEMFVVTFGRRFTKWKIEPKARFRHDLGSSIMCLKVWKDRIILGTENTMQLMDIAKEGLPVVMSEDGQTLNIGLYERDDCLAIACADGHSIRKITCKKDMMLKMEMFEVNQILQKVSIVDCGTVLGLHVDEVVMVNAGFRKTVKVPKGLAVEDRGQFCIIGTGSICTITVIDRTERLRGYASSGKWDLLFQQMMSLDDLPEFPVTLNSYLKLEEFDPNLVFNTLERLGITDYFTVEGMIYTSRDKLLVEFVNLKKTNWALTISFVKEVITTVQDDMVITRFLEVFELDIMWMRDVVDVCFSRGLFHTIAFLAREYLHDYYIEYVIALFTEDFAKIHEMANRLLDRNDYVHLFDDTILFFKTHDLRSIVKFDEQSAEIALGFVVNMMRGDKRREKRSDFEAVINRIIMAIEVESVIWALVSDVVLKWQMILHKDAMPSLENFIFFSKKACVNGNELVVMLLRTGQIEDLVKYRDLAGSCGYEKAECEIILAMRDVGELVAYFVTHKIVHFKDDLLSIVQEDEMQTVLGRFSSLLLGLNPDEFCELVWSSSPQLAHTMGVSFARYSPQQWHFYKRLFKIPAFADGADGDEITAYLTMLCNYKPAEVFSALKLIRHMPPGEVLKITQLYQIVDATLYLCDIVHDLAGACRFARDSVTRALMEAQNASVIDDICAYLSNDLNGSKKGMWLEIMEAFKLPLFAFREIPEKLNTVVDILNRYTHAMVIEYDDTSAIAPHLSSLFSFLPLKTARPILVQFFQSLREKYETKGVLARIVKDEAVRREINVMRRLGSGYICDAQKCRQCQRQLGQGVAIVAGCGHVFHEECAATGWCPECCIEFDVNRIKRIAAKSRHGSIMSAVPPMEDVSTYVECACPSIGESVVRL